MSKESKQNRKDNAVNNQLFQNKTKINQVDNEVTKLTRDFNAHILRHILDDLQAERFPGSGKPLYTYEEIAARYDTSGSTISRIAAENNLLRRKKDNA